MDISKDPNRYVVIWVLISLLGSSFEPIIVKYCGEKNALIDLVILKTLIASYLFSPMYFTLTKISRSHLFEMIKLSVLAIITNALVILSLKTIQASTTITIITCTPIVVGLINQKKGKVTLTHQFFAAFITVLIGITLTLRLTDGSHYKEYLKSGALFALISIFTSSMYRIKVDELVKDLSPLTVSGYLFMISGIIATLFLPFVEISASHTYLGFILAGIAIIANIAFLNGIKLLGSTRASMIAVLQRPLAVLIGSFILKEDFTYAQVAGMLMVFGGVYYAKAPRIETKEFR